MAISEASLEAVGVPLLLDSSDRYSKWLCRISMVSLQKHQLMAADRLISMNQGILQVFIDRLEVQPLGVNVLRCAG